MNTLESEVRSQKSEGERSTLDNPTPHLNRQRVKQTALEMARQLRPANKFTRVSLSFLQRVEAKTRAYIAEQVRMHPSTGRTLQ